MSWAIANIIVPLAEVLFETRIDWQLSVSVPVILAVTLLGLACFSLGAALWGAGSPNNQARRRGYRGVMYGLTMIGVSMGGALFTVFASVFTTL
jgi:hypothetical protein